MKIPIGLPVLCLTWLALTAQTCRAEDNEIRWVVSDWPPAYVLKNGATPRTPAELGDGTNDRIIAELSKRLPQYRFSFTKANPLRSWSEFAAGKNLCNASAFKTPQREKLAYFVPVVLIPPVNVVIRADRKLQLGLTEPTISLEKLIGTRRDLTGYIDSGRSFGPVIDPILLRAGSNLLRPVEPDPGHLLKLLDVGRMDYTMEYPMQVTYEQRRSQFTHVLEVVPIEEAQEWITGYVACTKNAWGKLVMGDIAKALADASRTNTFRTIIPDWLPATDKGYRKKIDAFYDDLPHQLELAK